MDFREPGVWQVLVELAGTDRLEVLDRARCPEHLGGVVSAGNQVVSQPDLDLKPATHKVVVMRQRLGLTELRSRSPVDRKRHREWDVTRRLDMVPPSKRDVENLAGRQCAYVMDGNIIAHTNRIDLPPTYSPPTHQATRASLPRGRGAAAGTLNGSARQ